MHFLIFTACPSLASFGTGELDGVVQAFATTPVCKQAEDLQKNEKIPDVIIAVTVKKVPNRLQPIISPKSMYY